MPPDLLRDFRARARELREMETVQFEESLGLPVSRERREFARRIEAAQGAVEAVLGPGVLEGLTDFLRRVGR